jgi:hypothetical protein
MPNEVTTIDLINGVTKLCKIGLVDKRPPLTFLFNYLKDEDGRE